MSIYNLFPYLTKKDKFKLLKKDEESKKYITTRKYATKITNIIKNHMLNIYQNMSDVIVTDLFSGNGGNCLSFALTFGNVNACEIDTERYNNLINNIGVYELKNVATYHGDALNYVYHFDNHNVVFIDPPWGGSDYKKKSTIRLTIGEISIETICNNIFENSVKIPHLVVLKLPINYDLEYFNKYVHKKNVVVYN